jgi:hypothetical protein
MNKIGLMLHNHLILIYILYGVLKMAGLESIGG